MEPVQPHLDTFKAIHVEEEEDDNRGGKELIIITDNNEEPRRSCSCVEEEDEERRSNASLCSVEVDLELGVPQKDVHSEKDCRICHMTLDETNLESGVPIELGCSCKDDLAAAHKHCAETWFKLKGNK